MGRFLLAALAACGLGFVHSSTSYAAEGCGSLTVHITNMRMTNGRVEGAILASLFNNEKGWPKPKHAMMNMTLTPQGARAFAIDDLPAGPYAMAIGHDRNGNGKIDTVFGIATEGYGYSNDSKLVLGAPFYQDAVFMVKCGHNEISMKLRYH